jgi:mono/diheme cytochrome c family protein
LDNEEKDQGVSKFLTKCNNLVWYLFIIMLLLGSLTACSLFRADPAPSQIPGESIDPAQHMGAGRGMMSRHHANIPEQYSGFRNPILADEESLSLGEDIYSENCAICHGDGGMGDGSGGANLNPAPAPIAHTSLMLSDSYLFWRISEGGVDFETGMPAYQDLLDEKSRWDVINYIRSLGSQTVISGTGMLDRERVSEEQVQIREQMLNEAINLGVISQNEADTFARVHLEIDKFLTEYPDILQGKGMDAMLEVVLSEMVIQNLISEIEADGFFAAHEKIESAGLMR